ncbi:MAG: hypothetical protein JRN15_05180 [Nitrososphaerota archaeon]|nr:hypothetical protein [Nitrososphaerota archaeon]
MSETIAVTEPILPRFVAHCEDCGVSKTFHTELGVNYFEDVHEGHAVRVEDDLKEPQLESELSAPVAEHSNQILNQPSPIDVLQVLSNINVIAQETNPRMQLMEQIPVQHLPEVIEDEPVSKVVADMPTPSEELPETKVSVVRVSAQPEEPVSVEEPCVLLSKYSFVKEGERYAREAIRVSQALQDLRWKIEPPYVISALFDDNLGIESNTGSMGRELLSKIEGIGYKFVAMESPKGVLTAWFKREN